VNLLRLVLLALLVAPWAHAAAAPDPLLGPLRVLLADAPSTRVSAPPAAVSASQYEQTTSRTEMRRQGCAAGRRDAGGLTILDFGKPAWNGHSYGTILFSERFASNKAITRALYAFAVSYVRCLPSGSDRRIVLGRGTSNYGIAVPSRYDAGRAWARETHRLGSLFAAHRNLAEHVTSAAADDIEPAWDTRFHRTRGFLRGFRAAPGYELLYNFGSLDGGGIWSVKQAYYASVRGNTRVVPQIYSRAMAHQWAELARSGLRTFHRPLRFAGVVTQGRDRCRCSLEPHDARRELQRALALHVGATAPDVPPTLTNIAF
jgi:hypothetical protein